MVEIPTREGQEMSSYFNDAGEPLMTAAQARFEADLDAQAAEDRYYDDFYDERRDEYIDSLACSHDLNWSQTNVAAECDDCGIEGVPHHDRLGSTILIEWNDGKVWRE